MPRPYLEVANVNIRMVVFYNNYFRFLPLDLQDLQACKHFVELHNRPTVQHIVVQYRIVHHHSYEHILNTNSFYIYIVFIHFNCCPLQVAEVAQILDFLSTQTALPIVGISGGSAVVIPHKVLTRSISTSAIL